MGGGMADEQHESACQCGSPQSLSWPSLIYISGSRKTLASYDAYGQAVTMQVG